MTDKEYIAEWLRKLELEEYDLDGGVVASIMREMRMVLNDKTS